MIVTRNTHYNLELFTTFTNKMRTQPQDITLKNAINNINETHEKYTSTQDIVTI